MLNVVNTFEAVVSSNYGVFIDVSSFPFKDYLFQCNRVVLTKVLFWLAFYPVSSYEIVHRQQQHCFHHLVQPLFLILTLIFLGVTNYVFKFDVEIVSSFVSTERNVVFITVFTGFPFSDVTV